MNMLFTITLNVCCNILPAAVARLKKNTAQWFRLAYSAFLSPFAGTIL